MVVIGIGEITTNIASKLATWSEPSQVIVICGHNKKVSDQLKSKSWTPNVNVVVKGFVENIDEYMSASDCLVTKAGPGTIAEAMICGLPVIISSFLPGQVCMLFLLFLLIIHIQILNRRLAMCLMLSMVVSAFIARTNQERLRIQFWSCSLMIHGCKR